MNGISSFSGFLLFVMKQLVLSKYFTIMKAGDVDQEQANVSILINWWGKYSSFCIKSTWVIDSCSKVCSVLLLTCREMYNILKMFSNIKYWTFKMCFIAKNRKKLILLWLLVKHQHFSQNKNSEFVTSTTHTEKVVPYLFCSVVSQQVMDTNFSKTRLRIK